MPEYDYDELVNCYYCEFCEEEGHSFRGCPARDDDPETYEDEDDA